MAAESVPPARPVYHSSAAAGRGRPRQGSMRKSSYSSPLPPTVESERTLCPRDTDTLSIQPEFLPRWFPPHHLWDKLPSSLQSAILHLQKAGAAVHSGYDRLEQYSGDIDIGTNADAPEDEMLVQLDESVSSLSSIYSPVPRLRTESSAGSSVAVSSPSSSSPHSPKWDSSLHPIGPISPLSLAADAQLSTNRPRERSFSTPLEPHNAKYATELSFLRTETIPCLRHAARAVDAEWKQACSDEALILEDVREEFKNWWEDKKITIMTLDEKARRLSDAMGLSPNGMGWTAP